MNNYDLLISKLDRFIRKYYVNQLIRGSLYTTAITLALFIAFNLIEYQFYLSSSGRKVLFFSFIAISLAAVLYWVAVPLLHYFRLGHIISHEQAANIIGNHFENVQDKLLNILQLKRQSESLPEKELILASISQKSNSIRLVPFRTAIDLQKNRKYLRYALPPFLILLLLLFGAPSIITDSTNRIINNNKKFEKPAPFYFQIDDDHLKVVQYNDFVLHVEVDGDKIPAEAYIDIDNYQYRLNKISAGEFSYVFKNVQKNQSFKLFSGSVKSSNKTLEVLPKPNLVDFTVQLDFPNYINRKNEVIQNIGDFAIPVGTSIRWLFNTNNTENINIKYSSSPSNKVSAERKGKNNFLYGKKILKDEVYTLYVTNKYVPRGDSVSYTLNVIPDQFPSINVQSFQDSLEKTLLYFVGTASDDYGLTSLSFHYQHANENGVEIDARTIKLPDPDSREIQYDYLFDVQDLNLAPGDRVNYYFEVYDNDAVNGSKSAKTNIMSFSKPTIEEFKEKEDENEEEIKDNLQESLDEIKKLQEELRKMREKLLQEKELDWQSKKDLEELLNKQKELQEKLERAKEKYEENLKNQNEFSEQSEEILEKQKQLQKLFEETMDEEAQELMDKIQDLLEELNKENSIQMLDQFEMTEEAMEKNMDRLLELFKQLELEKELNETIQDLNELAEEQEELSEETKKQSEEQSKDNNSEGENEKQKEEENQTEGEQKSESDKQEDLEKQQEEINDKFEEIKDQLQNIEEQNQNLEFPKDLGDNLDEQTEEIDEDLQNSQQQLQQNQNKKASQSQKNASQKMKSMAGNLQSQMQQGQMDQMAEDLQMLRQLLENLVSLSFDQEDLIGDFSRVNVNTPRYVSLVQEQFKIKDDFQLVEDSLQALSKRVAQIETFVIDKVAEINYNMDESLEKLEERQKPIASQHQRFTMKNLNDLALMLSESMNNMQQQMAAMMQGNQMCNNPGQNNGQQGKNGQVPMDKITEGQEQLKEGMEKMLEEIRNGRSGSAKEFAESAAKQAALRKAMEQMQKINEEQGHGTSKELQEIIDQMDRNEIDLVNKRLNNEMITRQQDIITRLLEEEKAERQREFENKRKSQTAEEIQRKIPPSLEEYIKFKEAEIDMYKSISPSLKPYYKQLVEEYYKALKSVGSH